jgi:outer membrane immunogenic protein
MMKMNVSILPLLMALSVGSAVAADLPSRKASPVPLPPPPSSWTGFYVGLNAGYAWGDDNALYFANPLAFVNPAATPLGQAAALAAAASGTNTLHPGSQGGFIGGGQVGYNYQFGGSFVVGLEADFQGLSSGNSSRTIASAAPWSNYFISGVTTTVQSVSGSLDYLGTVRGRAGYLVFPQLLVYGTGGLAYGGAQLSAAMLQADNPAPYSQNGAWAAAGNYSDTRVGWTAGGGVEYKFFDNWSAKVEYLYYNLGSTTLGLGATGRIYNANDPFNNAGQWHTLLAPSLSTRFSGNLIRFGVNYHFNWSAPTPILAKY